MNNLRVNFKKYDIFLTQSNVWEEFELTLKYVLRNDNNYDLNAIATDINYYHLQKLFSQVQFQDSKRSRSILEKIIEDELNLVVETINNDMPTINLKQYIHIWITYNNFCRKMNCFVKSLSNLYTNIEINSKQYALGDYQMMRFYLKVVNLKVKSLNSSEISPEINLDKNHLEKKSTLIDSHGLNQVPHSKEESNISFLISHIADQWLNLTKDEINLLVEFISSLRSFRRIRNLLEEMDPSQKDKLKELDKLIRSILNNPIAINNLSYRIDLLIRKDLKQGNSEEDSKAQRTQAQVLSEIYRLVDLMIYNCDGFLIYTYYKKFLCARLLQPELKEFDLELLLIKNLSKRIGQKQTKELQTIVRNIMHSRDVNNLLLGSTKIVIKSQKFLEIEKYLNIKKLRALVIDNNSWGLKESIGSIEDIPHITFPPEIEFYLSVFRNTYEDRYEHKYELTLQPTLGFIKLSLNNFVKGKDEKDSNNKYILCTFLQAAILCLFNYSNKMNLQTITKNLNINDSLCMVIVQSLINTGIIVPIRASNTSYEYYINKNIQIMRELNTIIEFRKLMLVDNLREAKKISNREVIAIYRKSVHD
jgi:hypothetical protein